MGLVRDSMSLYYKGFSTVISHEMQIHPILPLCYSFIHSKTHTGYQALRHWRQSKEIDIMLTVTEFTYWNQEKDNKQRGKISGHPESDGCFG